MGFWIFMFVCNLLIPIIMIGFGGAMKKHAPKEINGIYGYRTSMSMKNVDTWNFAHQYCGKLWWMLGWIMVPITVFLMLLLLGSGIDMTGIWGGIICILQCVALVVSIYPVEKALRKNFDKNGKRKI